MTVSDQVIAERKAEAFLLIFGPDDKDAQKATNILAKKYGTDNPRNVWIKLEMRGIHTIAEINERECTRCHKIYDATDPDSLSTLCGSKCYKAHMEDFVAKHPEFTEERKRFWLRFT